MVATAQSDAWHAALASEPRRRVLAMLSESPDPLDALTVATGVGVHVTTARFHLDQLEAAGLVSRQVARSGRRGRPQVLFQAVASPLPSEDAQHQLTHALAAVIGEDGDGGRARAVRAGERWSAQYTTGTAADPVPPIMDVLTEIGFEPQLRADEGTIALPACPFRAEARATPDVVCSVHLGLLRGVARSLGHDGEDLGLRPFVQPDLCVVDLPHRWTDSATGA
jgi:predicted ArsR family transcriptional regulator